MHTNKKDNPLGKRKVYKSTYDKSLLYRIKRSDSRKKYEINNINFIGCDMWNGYELSWLNKKGLPQVRIITITYSAQSKYIVESKSLKLYFNSFNLSHFNNGEEVKETIYNDLKELLGSPFLEVKLYTEYNFHATYKKIPKQYLIDDLSVSIKKYNVSNGLLKIKKKKMKQRLLFSNLLKTNCPITGQPDWATIKIEYKSNKKLTKKSLLRYIVSYRNEKDYHENCCERIFNDIFAKVSPEYLLVACYYTRRGGIDINPLRIYGKKEESCLTSNHYWRQ